jgi:hypothetical protein
MTKREMDLELNLPIQPIGERVKEIMKLKKLNMNSLSNLLRLKSNSIITRIVNDPERGMSLELIQRFLIEFGEINPDWFITGRGEMLKPVPEKKPEVEEKTCQECPRKDEKILHLQDLLKTKEEVIAAKDALIAALQQKAGLT